MDALISFELNAFMLFSREVLILPSLMAKKAATCLLMQKDVSVAVCVESYILAFN